MKRKTFALIFLAITVGCTISAQECGCTDPLAVNYDTAAVINDGSCQYQSSTVSLTKLGQFPPTLNSTSSLIYWDGAYWSCNDHTKLTLYKIDSLTGSITDSLLISEKTPRDMEEIAQDSVYLYFGDFGNNANTRTDLHILRVEKEALKNGNPSIDTIFFNYPNQTDFTQSSMETDFDCEAFIVGRDKIYLFTKQWSKKWTTLYELPKLPGNYVAEKKDSCNVQGLVTGAAFSEDSKLVVLCGYSSLLQPFIYLLYDYSDDNFFNGNKRKVELNVLCSQIEAIESRNFTDYYLTNEKFTFSSITLPASLYHLNLKDYLANYLYGESITESIDNKTITNNTLIELYPNPASEKIYISDYQKEIRRIAVYDLNGKQILYSSTEPTDNHYIDISQMKKGIYFVIMNLSDRHYVERKIVIK